MHHSDDTSKVVESGTSEAVSNTTHEEMGSLRAELEATILHQSQRVQELSQAQEALVATIAHDLKNPLTTILGRIEMLKRVVLRPSMTVADIERHLAPLETAATRLKELLEHFSQQSVSQQQGGEHR